MRCIDSSVVVRLRTGVALSGLAIALTAALPTVASAQEGQASVASVEDVTATADEGSGASTQKSSEIVVTGTLVRGIAPPGANVLATSQADILASGSTSVAQVLQTIPQLGSFNSLQQPLANSSEVAVNRPNLRSLPNVNTGSGSTTLVLMNGHRLVGMGVTSNSPDPDVIPPGVLERLEIVPDGGSAIYGSDAVAGVLNFVTIKRFNGVKIDGSYGFADNYYSWDANGTIGKDWGSGSIFASYSYAKNDQLLGRDRDFVRQFPNANGFTQLSCEPGNIEALAGQFAPRGTVRGVNGGAVNQCDASDFATVYPATERHSAFAGLTQKLSDKLAVELTAYYTNRKTYVQSGPHRANQIIFPSFFAGSAAALGISGVSSPFSPFAFGGFVNGQPVFVPGNNNAVDLIQQADFQIGAIDAQHTDIELDTWGTTANFNYDIDGNFRLSLLGNYGQSTATRINTSLNTRALQNAIAAGLFNPYNVSASNPAALAIIQNFEDYGKSRQRMVDFRAVVDGDLFQLPGGAAKIAIGAEYLDESFNSARGSAVPGFEFSEAPAQLVGATLVAPAQPGVFRFDVNRRVKSVFGELVAPVLGGDGGIGLTLSAAGRYDHYSDVGGTFNPRFGATFKPVDWVSLRGAWGTSFNAPGLGDAEDADVNTLFILTGQSGAFFAPPTSLVGTGPGRYPAYNGGTVVATRGNAPGIRPQTATTWTLGIDVDPPVVPGLRLSATYYDIFYKNLIGLAPFETPATLYRDYGNLITIAPSQAVLDAVLADADIIAAGNPPVSAAGTYAYFDARKRNLGDFKVDGIDFSVSYRTQFNSAELFFNSTGTYTLHRKLAITRGGPLLDVLVRNPSRISARTALGAQIGPVLGQVTWNYSEGSDVDPVVGFVPQTRLGAFNTFDLFFKFDVPGDSMVTRDLSFTVNVNNVFDTDPPEFRGNNQILGRLGYANGATLGRFVKIGASKKF